MVYWNISIIEIMKIVGKKVNIKRNELLENI